MDLIPKKGRIERAMQQLDIKQKKRLAPKINVTEQSLTMAIVHLKEMTYLRVIISMSLVFDLNYKWFYVDDKKVDYTPFKNQNSEAMLRFEKQLASQAKLLDLQNELINQKEMTLTTMGKVIVELERERTMKLLLYENLKVLFEDLNRKEKFGSNKMEEKEVSYKKESTKAQIDFVFKQLLEGKV